MEGEGLQYYTYGRGGAAQLSLLAVRKSGESLVCFLT